MWKMQGSLAPCGVMNGKREVAVASVASFMAAAVRKLNCENSYLNTFIFKKLDSYRTWYTPSSKKCFLFYKTRCFFQCHQDNSLIISFPVISYSAEANKYVVHEAVSLTKLSFLQTQDFHWCLDLVSRNIFISTQLWNSFLFPSQPFTCKVFQ